jgi:hypothetical protein
MMQQQQQTDNGYQVGRGFQYGGHTCPECGGHLNAVKHNKYGGGDGRNTTLFICPTAIGEQVSTQYGHRMAKGAVHKRVEYYVETASGRGIRPYVGGVK